MFLEDIISIYPFNRNLYYEHYNSNRYDKSTLIFLQQKETPHAITRHEMFPDDPDYCAESSLSTLISQLHR